MSLDILDNLLLRQQNLLSSMKPGETAPISAAADTSRHDTYRNTETDMESFAAEIDAFGKNDENVLLTIGSKELEPFTHVSDYDSRFYVRILPMRESLQKALNLGFRASNIICMQGPFDMEINKAMLKMTGATYLITKDSGDVGGFEAKVSAALSLGCKIVVITRPVEETGHTFEELLENFNVKEISEEPQQETAFFPLFVDMRGRKALVIGGGKIAERRIKTLTSFGVDITVISPASGEHIVTAASQGILQLIERKYEHGDITELKPFLVIAATDDRQANHEAMLEAASLDIHVSVADRREECSFYFPAIAQSDAYLAGLVSKNGDHKGVKRMAEAIRGILIT